jgi:protein-disulfide isomerase
MAPYRRLSLVLFALVAAVGMRAASAATTPAPKPAMAEEMTLGNPKAKVTVIEYASAACPHCAAFNNDVFPEFKKKYVDTGKVRYVFREMLTDPVPFAGAAFLIARCAGDDKYFAVLDDVFHEQQAIYQSGDLPGGLLKIAEKFGLTREQVSSCTSDEKMVQGLNDRVTKADHDGFNATPTFVIGETKIEGEKPLADLSAVIDPLLAK